MWELGSSVYTNANQAQKSALWLFLTRNLRFIVSAPRALSSLSLFILLRFLRLPSGANDEITNNDGLTVYEGLSHADLA